MPHKPSHSHPSSAFSHWSRYWSGGALTSLPEDFAVNYEGEIARFWQSVFDALPAGARVVDLCSGNGPIALMAATHSRSAEVLAVDAAQISPSVIAQRYPHLRDALGRVRFHGGQAVESLTLEPGSVDLVSSQYGIEYTDWDRIATNIAGWLRPGGRLALVSHVPDSGMVEVMSREEADYARLFAIPAWAELRQSMGEDGGLPPKRLRGLLSTIRREMTVPGAADSPLQSSVLAAVQALLAMSENVLTREGPRVADYLTELDSGHQRLQDMLAVNRALLDEPEWFRCFEQAGLTLRSRQSLDHAGRHRCGLALEFQRPLDPA
jgi:SAM-dependent methyltransferase